MALKANMQSTRQADEDIIAPLKWMSTVPVEKCIAPLRSYEIAVAVPARDEADMIVACLAALHTSAERAGQHRLSVTVLVNNSSDATAQLARAFKSTNMVVRVVEIMLDASNAHAGGARRYALDLALADLSDTGVLMTTDADSRVDPCWIAANLVEIEAGADAVAGVVTFAPDANLSVAASRHAEWRLSHLQARLHSLLDPRPQERWPTHIWAWGASLAVKASAYRAVGGVPAIPLAEDRAFADVLDRHGFHVRRSHAPIVVTSHRRHGRAPGGLADMLTAYGDDAMPCDAALEPTASLVRRLSWRSYLRQLYAEEGSNVCARMISRLAIKPDTLTSVDFTTFGHWWSAIENASPRLQRMRIVTAALPRELRLAERMINLIEHRARRGGTEAYAVALIPRV